MQRADLFRSVPGLSRRGAVETDPRVAVENAVRDLLRVLAALPKAPTLRVADAEGEVACLVQVWHTGGMMPTGSERRRRNGGGREECRKDVMDAVRAAEQPLTRKEVVKALREAGKDHGQGTIAKALADLTAAGELVNP